MSDIIVPSNPKDRQMLKQVLVEMTNCMLRVDSEKEAMKELADSASEKFEIPKKIINKIARTMYKRNYSSLQAENEDFSLLYETLVESKITNTTEEDEE